VIRLATPDDAAGIARVHVATWRHAYAGLVDAAYLDGLSVAAGTSRWAGLLADGDAATYVALEPDGDVVGFATAGPARDADAEGAGEVYAVYVHPAAQRGGLGGALLDAACGWLADRGHRPVLLWVLTGNAAARAFYAARGGAPDGTDRTIDVGGAIVAEVRYRFVPVPAT
jgi:GNAT superfamily N-acetyltransferase